MRKIILVLSIFFTFLFSSCGGISNEEYIENIKNFSFKGNEFYYATNIEELARNICITSQYFTPVDKRDLKWSIEETNKKEKTKIVKCEYRGNKIFFITYYNDEGFTVDLKRSYTVSQLGWQNSILEFSTLEHPNLEQYFK